MKKQKIRTILDTSVNLFWVLEIPFWSMYLFENMLDILRTICPFLNSALGNLYTFFCLDIIIVQKLAFKLIHTGDHLTSLLDYIIFDVVTFFCCCYPCHFHHHYHLYHHNQGSKFRKRSESRGWNNQSEFPENKLKIKNTVTQKC